MLHFVARQLSAGRIGCIQGAILGVQMLHYVGFHLFTPSKTTPGLARSYALIQSPEIVSSHTDHLAFKLYWPHDE